MKKVAFFTLGCKVNQYETQLMIEKFEKSGYTVVRDDEMADVYVINTCTVTSESDKKSRKCISKANRMNSNAIIVVVGCYSQLSSESIRKISGVDIVMGSDNKADIVQVVESYVGEQISRVNDVMKKKNYDESGFISCSELTRAFVKIEDGCNNRCTYCTIPFARGIARSRSIVNVLEEVRKLANKGFKEIVLTGINLSFYGMDFGDSGAMVCLLNELNNIDGIERIRFGSVYPEMFTTEFLNCLKNMPKMCSHFHISLQSGCDDTLRRMGRRYTVKDYDNVLAKLKEIRDDIAVTTDIIVGFPGENDYEFAKTYDYLKESMLMRFHVFPYSKRDGTLASEMPMQIDSYLKDERVKKLLDLSELKEKEFYNNFVGKEMKVLFEKKVRDNLYEGHTENFIKVQKKFDSDVVGKIVSIVL